ncbi:AbrB/MazE/SpoVT family DNA-binding domain-containing protein [Candidatus Curtissbacteria bacterium]|nr:AbrB/MazE/SpoVT family DNA-binding domain-containing protein [Candidatus Curtissbacteria bacterium]
MRQNTTPINQEEWLKILGKGMITLPKKWRDELGIESGDIVKAKKEGDRVVIEPQDAQSAPYRIYTDAEIDEFLKEDMLPSDLARKVDADLARKKSRDQ